MTKPRLEKTIEFYEKRIAGGTLEELRRYVEMMRDIKPDINTRQYYLNCLVAYWVGEQQKRGA